MVNTAELESYLNDKSAKDKDIIEILGEGEFVFIETQDGKKKKVLNLPVKLNGSLDLIYTPGKVAIGVLNKAWTTDTKTWIGKKFQVTFVKMQIGKEIKEVIAPNPLQ